MPTIELLKDIIEKSDGVHFHSLPEPDAPLQVTLDKFKEACQSWVSIIQWTAPGKSNERPINYKKHQKALQEPLQLSGDFSANIPLLETKLKDVIEAPLKELVTILLINGDQLSKKVTWKVFCVALHRVNSIRGYIQKLEVPNGLKTCKEEYNDKVKLLNKLKMQFTDLSNFYEKYNAWRKKLKNPENVNSADFPILIVHSVIEKWEYHLLKQNIVEELVREKEIKPLDGHSVVCPVNNKELYFKFRPFFQSDGNLPDFSWMEVAVQTFYQVLYANTPWIKERVIAPTLLVAFRAPCNFQFPGIEAFTTALVSQGVAGDDLVKAVRSSAQNKFSIGQVNQRLDSQSFTALMLFHAMINVVDGKLDNYFAEEFGNNPTPAMRFCGIDHELSFGYPVVRIIRDGSAVHTTSIRSVLFLMKDAMERNIDIKFIDVLNEHLSPAAMIVMWLKILAENVYPWGKINGTGNELPSGFRPGIIEEVYRKLCCLKNLLEDNKTSENLMNHDFILSKLEPDVAAFHQKLRQQPSDREEQSSLERQSEWLMMSRNNPLAAVTFERLGIKLSIKEETIASDSVLREKTPALLKSPQESLENWLNSLDFTTIKSKEDQNKFFYELKQCSKLTHLTLNQCHADILVDHLPTLLTSLLNLKKLTLRECKGLATGKLPGVLMRVTPLQIYWDGLDAKVEDLDALMDSPACKSLTLMLRDNVKIAAKPTPSPNEMPTYWYNACKTKADVNIITFLIRKDYVLAALHVPHYLDDEVYRDFTSIALARYLSQLPEKTNQEQRKKREQFRHYFSAMPDVWKPVFHTSLKNEIRSSFSKELVNQLEFYPFKNGHRLAQAAEDEKWQSTWAHFLVDEDSIPSTPNAGLIKVRHPLFKGRYESLVRPEVMKLLLEDKWLTEQQGDFDFNHPKRAPAANHLVIPLSFEGREIHLKVKPECPGMEKAVGELHRLVVGGGTAAGVLWRWTYKKLTYSVWVSETIRGEDPGSRPDLLDKSKLDAKAFGQMFIMAFLTAPEDGKPENFKLLRSNPMKERYQFVGVDNDRPFVPSFEFNKKTKKWHIRIKSLLYCCDMMEIPFGPEVIEELRQLDPCAVITQWLDALILWNTECREKIFPGQVEGNVVQSTYLLSRIKKGTVQNIFNQLQWLQSRLFENPKITPFECLQGYYYPELARLYRATFRKEGRRDPMRQLQEVTKGEYKVKEIIQADGKKLLRFSTSTRLDNYIQMVSSSELDDSQAEELWEYDLAQARREVIELSKSEEQLQKAKAACLKGDLQLLKNLPTDEAKERVINDLGNWENVQYRIIPALLTLMHSILWRELKIKGGDVAPIIYWDKIFVTLLSQQPNLQRLTISGCSTMFETLQTLIYHPVLKYLEFSQTGLRGNVDISPGLLSRDMTFPTLNTLILRNCCQLTNFTLHAPQLEFLDLSGCSQLQSLTLKAPILKSLNTSLCNQLSDIFFLEQTGIGVRALDISDCKVKNIPATNKQKGKYWSQDPCDWFPELQALILKQCVNLRSINLYANKLTKIDLSGCINLVSVAIAEAGFKRLKANGCVKLERLAISNNYNLEHLELLNCQALHEAHLQDLVKNCSTIKSIELTGCENISPENYLFLKHYPWLYALGWNKYSTIVVKGIYDALREGDWDNSNVLVRSTLLDVANKWQLEQEVILKKFLENVSVYRQELNAYIVRFAPDIIISAVLPAVLKEVYDIRYAEVIAICVNNISEQLTISDVLPAVIKRSAHSVKEEYFARKACADALGACAARLSEKTVVSVVLPALLDTLRYGKYNYRYVYKAHNVALRVCMARLSTDVITFKLLPIYIDGLRNSNGYVRAGCAEALAVCVTKLPIEPIISKVLPALWMAIKDIDANDSEVLTVYTKAIADSCMSLSSEHIVSIVLPALLHSLKSKEYNKYDINNSYYTYKNVLGSFIEKLTPTLISSHVLPALIMELSEVNYGNGMNYSFVTHALSDFIVKLTPQIIATSILPHLVEHLFNHSSRYSYRTETAATATALEACVAKLSENDILASGLIRTVLSVLTNESMCNNHHDVIWRVLSSSIKKLSSNVLATNVLPDLLNSFNEINSSDEKRIICAEALGVCVQNLLPEIVATVVLPVFLHKLTSDTFVFNEYNIYLAYLELLRICVTKLSSNVIIYHLLSVLWPLLENHRATTNNNISDAYEEVLNACIIVLSTDEIILNMLPSLLDRLKKGHGAHRLCQKALITSLEKLTSSDIISKILPALLDKLKNIEYHDYFYDACNKVLKLSVDKLSADDICTVLLPGLLSELKDVNNNDAFRSACAEVIALCVAKLSSKNIVIAVLPPLLGSLKNMDARNIIYKTCIKALEACILKLPLKVIVTKILPCLLDELGESFSIYSETVDANILAVCITKLTSVVIIAPSILPRLLNRIVDQNKSLFFQAYNRALVACIMKFSSDIGSDIQPVLPALLKLTANNYNYVDSFVAFIKKLPVDVIASEILPLLLEGLEYIDDCDVSTVYKNSLKACIVKLTPAFIISTVIPILLNLLNSPNSNNVVRTTCIIILTTSVIPNIPLDVISSDLISALLSKLKDDDITIRSLCIKGLGYIAEKEFLFVAFQKRFQMALNAIKDSTSNAKELNITDSHMIESSSITPSLSQSKNSIFFSPRIESNIAELKEGDKVEQVSGNNR